MIARPLRPERAVHSAPISLLKVSFYYYYFFPPNVVVVVVVVVGRQWSEQSRSGWLSPPQHTAQATACACAGARRKREAPLSH